MKSLYLLYIPLEKSEMFFSAPTYLRVEDSISELGGGCAGTMSALWVIVMSLLFRFSCVTFPEGIVLISLVCVVRRYLVRQPPPGIALPTPRQLSHILNKKQPRQTEDQQKSTKYRYAL